MNRICNRLRLLPQWRAFNRSLAPVILIALAALAGVSSHATAANVVSTSPADGSANVSVNLSAVSITFSEPMGANSSYTTEVDFWGPLGGPSWSSDRLTLTISRNSQEPIPVGVTLRFALTLLADAAGNPLNHPGQAPGQYSFSFMVGTSVDQVPTVVSTTPADGAIGVSLDLSTVTMTFSEPMDRCCVSIGSSFPSYTRTWSQDHRQLTLTRVDTQTTLPPGVTYGFVLNGVGYENFRDTQGNFLPETRFSFTTTDDYDYQTLKISENPARGFHWPYYLCVPNSLGKRSILLVEPNNTGTWSDDIAVHDQAALTLLRSRADFAKELDVPLLIPTFPRPINPPAPEPGGIYTHALDRYSLLTTALVSGRSIQRIDLQLIAMIRDAQERLAGMGFRLDRKIFMIGFSASGAFTGRFTTLHPEIVRAAAPGSPGGWPLAPVSSWNGIVMRYPVGISDLQALIGSSFDLSSYRRVPQYIYVGNLDRNDALDTRGIPQQERDAICNLLDCRPEPYISNRWPIAEDIQESVNVFNQFIIYPNVAHTITDTMFEDVMAFFNAHKPPKPGANAPVQLLLMSD